RRGPPPPSPSARARFPRSWLMVRRALAAALHPGANRFTHHGSFYITRFAQIKDNDRQIVIHAHRNRGRVHHLEVLLKDLDIGEAIEAAGVRLTHGVAIVNP